MSFSNHGDRRTLVFPLTEAPVVTTSTSLWEGFKWRKCYLSNIDQGQRGWDYNFLKDFCGELYYSWSFDSGTRVLLNSSSSKLLRVFIYTIELLCHLPCIEVFQIFAWCRYFFIRYLVTSIAGHFSCHCMNITINTFACRYAAWVRETGRRGWI